MKDTARKDYQMATLNELLGEYSVTTIDEYFAILDREEAKRSQMVAKSLTKYLKKAQANQNNKKRILALH